jgi:CubicO group peptidase (beta-lactamase class C family)
MPVNIKRALCLPLLLAGVFAYAAPDEDVLGKSEGYPYPHSKDAWRDMDERLKIGEFSHADDIFETRPVARGAAVSALEKAADAPQIRYRFGNATYSVDDYLAHQRCTGLLVLKNGKIVVERYQYQRLPEGRLISFSLAKSITATLIGIALHDGKIGSLDDTVERYVPGLAGGPYARISIRNLLRMSSGVQFNYVKNGGSGDDSDTLNRNTMMQQNAGGVAAIAFVRNALAPQGTAFHYSNGDTFVLGLVLQAALAAGHEPGKGPSVAQYTAEKLWQPLGAEDGASWIVDKAGATVMQAGFNARLRDYGRLGLLWANDGQVDGKVVLDRQFMLDATDIARQPAHLKPHGQVDYGMAYGYQFWLTNFKSRTFSAIGAYGQQILVQPEAGIVLVMTAASRTVDENIPERRAFIQGVIRSLGGSTEPLLQRAAGAASPD